VAGADGASPADDVGGHALFQGVFPHKTGCTDIKSTSKHWLCLFPQHGPGRKHRRKIELEPWQERIVAEYPGDFARGLFHSDGSRAMNRVRPPLKNGDRWYEYPRYFFVNHSVGIHRLGGGALDRLRPCSC
jgi:hypothetical protein